MGFERSVEPFLIFIIDDTGGWTEHRDTNSERNFENIQKTINPIFPRLHSLAVVETWKYGVCFFFKYKIGNNNFTTILGSENLNSMMFTTNYCSNPTVNVLVGSITHLESPWILNITPMLFTTSRDLILGLKNRIITILVVFISGSHREVAPLRLEFIGLWFICTKYINFLMSHIHDMYPSYPTITHSNWPQVSWTPSSL